jgi:hypothetical protein
MKAQSKEQPKLLEDLGNRYRFNFNIVEKEIEGDIFYEYESVESNNNRNQLVSNLIRRKYSQDDEFALINNYNLDNSKYQQEYDAYQNYRIECKEIANIFFK